MCRFDIKNIGIRTQSCEKLMKIKKHIFIHILKNNTENVSNKDYMKEIKNVLESRNIYKIIWSGYECLSLISSCNGDLSKWLIFQVFYCALSLWEFMLMHLFQVSFQQRAVQGVTARVGGPVAAIGRGRQGWWRHSCSLDARHLIGCASGLLLQFKLDWIGK